MVRRQRPSFGDILRSLREKKGLSLRAAARAAQISATYWSQVEHNQSQPTEGVVFKMAEALEYNEDELLAVRGLVAEDLQNIILKQPQTIASLLLAIDGLPAAEIEKLTSRAVQRKT